MNRREFLAGAAFLTAALPSEGRPRLLPLDSRPPDFSLPDGAGRRVSLHEFLGRKRIVVALQTLHATLEKALAASADYTERDLVVLAVNPHGGPVVEQPPLYSLTDATSATLRAYGVAGSETAFYLIGKDGGIKMARRDYPSNTELFAVIDAMPMRRRERREQGH